MRTKNFYIFADNYFWLEFTSVQTREDKAGGKIHLKREKSIKTMLLFSTKMYQKTIKILKRYQKDTETCQNYRKSA